MKKKTFLMMSFAMAAAFAALSLSAWASSSGSSEKRGFIDTRDVTNDGSNGITTWTLDTRPNMFMMIIR